MRNKEKDALEMTGRRQAMLDAGFRMFSERSIDAVTMNEVAVEAGLGIATLYRYYRTKLEFVIAIAVDQWQKTFAESSKRLEEFRLEKRTAAEGYEFFIDRFINLFKEKKDLLRFNQSFNNFVLHENATAEQMKPYIEIIENFRKNFHSVYEKALLDGTVRTDLPEEEMFSSALHIMLAVVVRYAQGLVYMSRSEEDMLKELVMLKNMMIKEYVIQR